MSKCGRSGLVWLLFALPCLATGFGQSWTQVTFGQPLPSVSMFAKSDDGVWAIGGRDGLSFSADGEHWSSVPGLPDDASSPYGFFHFNDRFMEINSIGFWTAESPEGVWTKAGEVPPMFESLGYMSFLPFKDRIYSVGGYKQSADDGTEIWSCTDGTDWRLEVDSPPFSDRSHFGAVSFKGKLWVLPGYPRRSLNPADDIWSSPDGITWQQEATALPFGRRWYYGTAVFKDRIYIIGGGGVGVVWSSGDGINWREEPVNDENLWLGSTLSKHGTVPQTFILNDHLYVVGGYFMATWRTADGVNWEQVPNSNPWAQRSAFASVVFKGQIYMLGGENPFGAISSVWRTPDGEHWEELLRTAPWPGRRGHAAVVKDGYIWIYGGGSRTEVYSDVWRSPDGIHWEQVTANAGWAPRYFFGAAAYDGSLWAAGGLDASSFSGVGPGSGRSDVWRSDDGVTWEQVSTTAAWGPNFSMGMVTHNNALWMVGGTRFTQNALLGVDKAWTSTDGINWTEANADLPFRGSVPALRSYAGKLWFSGGLAEINQGDTRYLESLWSSEDGVSWSKAGNSAAWMGRNAHGMEFLGNRLVLWGGDDGLYPYQGDIWISQGDIPHQTADINADLRLNISELLRLIQFYNAGALHAAPGTEDGFAPGVGDTTAPPHQSDYNPQDWKIDLPELLRAIQFYNAGGYTPCEAGEDGFCPEG